MKILMKRIPVAILCGASALIFTPQGFAQELQEKLASVKEAVARNQAALRQYTWTEHVEISLEGEVKKTKDDVCRYGSDGQVQKTQVDASPQKELRGVRGRIAERKKDELEDYMQNALALIHRYVPPAPQLMQQAFQAGNVSLGSGTPATIQLQFKNYLKPGDAMTLTFDPAAEQLRALTVNSYLSDLTDAVALNVNFQTLPDGTTYAATTVLDAPAKKLQVRIMNLNYQRIGG